MFGVVNMSVQELRPFCALELVMRKLLAEARAGSLVEVRVTVGRSDGHVEHFVIERDSLQKPNVFAA